MQSQTFVFEEDTQQETNEGIGQNDIESVLNTNWDGATQFSTYPDLAGNQKNDMKSVFMQLNNQKKPVATGNFKTNEPPRDVKDIKASIDELFIQEVVNDDKRLNFKNYDSRTENRLLLQR